MSKYIEQTGDKELIIKTNPDIIYNNLRNAKNDLIIDKNKYNILEYTKDYINNLLTNIENINKNWNYLLDAAMLYHYEINYRDEVSYTGVKDSIEYKEILEATEGVVNTKSDYLNVRSSPNGDIITSIPPGTNVKILEGDNNGWTKISFNGEEAYVCSRYLTTDVPFNPIDTKTVNSSNITVRNFVDGQIINTLSYNNQVQVLEELDNGWTKILFDNRIAFVNSKDLI